MSADMSIPPNACLPEQLVALWSEVDLVSLLPKAMQQQDSLYLYQEAGMERQIRALQQVFPCVRFLYSLKCNPNPHVVRTVFAHGLGADAASLGEVLLARNMGCAAGDIQFSAPGKSRSDLQQALGKCVVIADSLHELELLEELARQSGRPVQIGLRINPNFTLEEEIPVPSKFGIDEEQALTFLRSGSCLHLQVRGLHVHLRSQELDANKLAWYYRHILALADRLQQECGVHLSFVNMGSGLGIPYGAGDSPIDMATLGRSTAEEIAHFRQKYPDMQFFIETGRYVVGQNGLYATRVLDKKVSCGRTYLVVKSTLNGFLRPCLARFVSRMTGGESAPASEPLFTQLDAHGIYALRTGQETEKVTVVGNLCTAMDVVAEEVELPVLDCGDILLLSNAGAYARVLSPLQFSSQDAPAEVFLTRDGVLLWS